jgi:4-carboxymuconolactone decarboxylase
MSDRALPAQLEELVKRYRLADVWAHPSLDQRARSIVALATCAVVGTGKDLADCITEAIDNGVTKPEIAEVFLHIATLAGLPVARQAFTVAQQVLTGQGQGNPPEHPKPQLPL